MIPMRTQFNVKSLSNASQATVFPSAEARRQWQTRAIRTDKHHFEVHVWGEAIPGDPALDFDATQVMYQQAIRTIHLRTAGHYELTDGAWMDQQPEATQLGKPGHWFAFGASFDTPVLDKILPFVPPATLPATSIFYIPPDGSPPGEAP